MTENIDGSQKRRMTSGQKSYAFKDDERLDQLLEKALLEHEREFKNKSDLLRKGCHFLLKTLGYRWDFNAEEDAVNADSHTSTDDEPTEEELAVNRG
jgi:Arc/MetJ-type ribon-helix-helix transcriptional regulator